MCRSSLSSTPSHPHYLSHITHHTSHITYALCRYSAYSDIAAKWGTTADELVSDAEVFQSFFDNLMPPPNGNFNDNNDNNDNIIYTNNENAIPTDDRLFGSLQVRVYVSAL